MNTLFIGTSGWNYKHWIGVFYPEDLPAKEQLAYYSKYFQTVEINNSFYHLPSLLAVKSWNCQPPGNFKFSVKCSRYITHIKKLKDSKAPIDIFLSRVVHLKKKLGPILFQLPPTWRLNFDRLAYFIKILPKKFKYVFEFRENSWFNDKVFKILSDQNIGFCIHDMAGASCPYFMTAKFSYFRFHGTGIAYGGRYSKNELVEKAVYIRRFLKKGNVYVYFNNDQNCFAVRNALELKKMFCGQA